jgi:RHS repeat-associated protein
VPFGAGYGEEGSEEFRYTGKYEDTTGLYYFGARYYDPNAGRFTTEDPVTGSLEDPQSLNRYTYCRNNPHKYTDPDGRFWNIVAGAIIGGTVSTIYYGITHRESFSWKEAGIAFTSGAVMGGIASLAGPAAGLGMKTVMTTSAATLSWTTETTLKTASGLDVQPQTAGEVVLEIALTAGISVGVGEIVNPLATKATSLLSNVVSADVPVYYSYPQKTAPLAGLIGGEIIRKTASKVVKHILDASKVQESNLYSYKHDEDFYWGKDI